MRAVVTSVWESEERGEGTNVSPVLTLKDWLKEVMSGAWSEGLE